MGNYGVIPFDPGLGESNPINPFAAIVSATGTRTSVPAGMEAVLEYNGLQMNIQRNIERYFITSIDGLFDADVRDTRDVNPNEDGETPYNSFYGGRTIVINGTILAYTLPKLRDMEQALRAAFIDLTTERPLIFRTGDFSTDHMIYCKKSVPISGIEQQQNQNVSRDFQITLRASNPRFLSYYQNFFDETFLAPVVNATHIGTITNKGNYKAQPVFRIYGKTHGSRFWNDRTGQMFSIEFVDDGDYVDFDMANKTLINHLGQNQWVWLSDDSEYIDILPGDNPIFFQGDSPEITISWHDSWG